jgi:hypothetical protein
LRNIPARLSSVAGFLLALLLIAESSTSSSTLRFYDDDPLPRDPETQDASRAEAWDIDLFYDLALNLFGRPGDPTPDVRAQNLNTIDEIPDSSWFTNRILARDVSVEEAARGPLAGTGPAAGTWTVSRPKSAGFAPGFTMEDAKGETWFVSFDARGMPEAATGAILVANKIFWTLGYWQVENHLIAIRPDQLVISSTATVTPPSGVRRSMKPSDLESVLQRAHRSEDGSYRAVAARAVPGRALGGFRYHDTRPDDPNDIVPHEHRRELRALKVFGAWTNLVDMKAGNTLDAVVTENGRAVVRHYLQDVGSTFGTGANGPREYDEGWEFVYEGDLAWKRLVSLGFYLQPWQTVRYVDVPAIGRFDGSYFDPVTWKPRVPTAAFLRARDDDNFWAARRVAAFSNEMIRALVKTGGYSDPVAAGHLAEVLIERRDRIAAAYLTPINPLVNFTLGAEGLSFENAAVAAGVAPAPAGGYLVRWSRFDNSTGDTKELAQPSVVARAPVPAPVGLPNEPGSYLKAQVSAVQPPHAAWATPTDVYFRRTPAGWKLVGVTRQPDGTATGDRRSRRGTQD